MATRYRITIAVGKMTIDSYYTVSGKGLLEPISYNSSKYFYVYKKVNEIQIETCIKLNSINQPYK